MNRELVIPNLHVILVHYPLGVFFTGLVIELLSLFWRRHAVRMAGHWMVLIGGLATLPTAMSGIYALHDVAVKDPEAAGVWKETIESAPLNAEQWEALRNHVLWGSIASVIICLTIVTYMALSDRLRSKLYLPLLGVLVFGAAMMGASAWHAGEAVYRYGVAVEPRGTAGGENPAPTEPGEPTSQPMEDKPFYAKLNTLFPPVQTHAIMAGLAAAVALASVGAAVRRVTGQTSDTPDDSAEALVKSLEPRPDPVVIRPGKYWLVTAFFFIATALGGWYVLGSSADTFVPKELWAMVADKSLNSGGVTRRLAHVILASVTILLPFVLAILGRWAPKQTIALLVVSAILFIAVGLQVWLGILLLFDTPLGPITRFN